MSTTPEKYQCTTVWRAVDIFSWSKSYCFPPKFNGFETKTASWLLYESLNFRQIMSQKLLLSLRLRYVCIMYHGGARLLPAL